VIVALRKRRHHLFMRLPEEQLPHFTHPDDAVRVYAFVYTLQKASLAPTHPPTQTDRMCTCPVV
jgi:hypothetical protein